MFAIPYYRVLSCLKFAIITIQKEREKHGVASCYGAVAFMIDKFTNRRTSYLILSKLVVLLNSDNGRGEQSSC
jgi:hypothetical protein